MPDPQPTTSESPRASLLNRATEAARRWTRRFRRRPRPVSETKNILPLLIKVLAGFSNVGGEVLEDEIDSILGSLRYDYPEAVYSELRELFRQALQEQQNLSEMARQLSDELSPDRKILLCVQLYDLIAKSGMKQEQVIAYYSFMSQLGMAAQAIDIVYQLNSSEGTDDSIFHEGTSPLESLVLGGDSKCEVVLKDLEPTDRLHAYRYHDLVLLKNLSDKQVVVRGRPLGKGEFCRVYAGQRIIVGEQVLTQQDLVFYFNAKKGVSTPQIFLKIDDNDEVELERSRSRDSCLEVNFGLRVKVKALKNVDAVLNGVKLRAGADAEGTLDDRIVFHDESELLLSDLRRRARAMGGRFQLKAYKSEYLVSNDPALLGEDDILLSPGTSGEVLLKIFCDYDAKVGRVEVLQSNRPILVGGLPVRNSASLADGDIIRIDQGQELRCDFTDRIIEEQRNIIRQLEVHDLGLSFKPNETALDGVTFSINRGEMVCVMGASGSGKSTLLRVLAGQLRPSRGSVLLNGLSLYDHTETLKGYVSYVPQDDAFDEHLTIEENLEFAAAIRAPHLSRRDRIRRVEGKLVELGLSERRDSVVGSAVRKILSGGERKRLNIGLDMIGSADVYLFDEPTSGLSSKDSEHVVEIIRGMSHNKIVLVTIHQPSSKIFHMFNKALLLDKGGKLVFFGTPSEMLNYFAEAEHEQHFGTALGACPACGTSRPEFIFDVLETPLRDLSGDIIYEESAKGQLVPARRFSPLYWRDKYESYRLLQDVRQVSVRREPAPPLPPAPAHKATRMRWRDEWIQFRTLLTRAFRSKLRNKANLLTTMVEAPLLAGLIGLVLRYSESGDYNFASAFHIPTYLFLGLVVAMFLGLTNSADDIIRDRVVLQRERNLNIRLGYYIAAKTITLALFAVLQCVFFVAIGNAILEIRGMFWWHLGYTVATALSGVAIGLVISSLVGDAKTAANIVPLVLIPQIILGGALIKYEEMNKNLDFVYAINRWISQNPGTEKPRQSELEVPWVCEFMPMRWSYEALVVCQAKLNPLTWRQDLLNRRITETVQALNSGDPKAEVRLANYKDALAILSGLEDGTASGVDRKLARIDDFLENPDTDPSRILRGGTGVTAEQLYVNQKVTDLVSKAEMEQADYRDTRKINVFFGLQKHYLGMNWSVYTFNALVLNLSTLGMLVLLFYSLRYQLRTRGIRP
jgi:ABC-type multidrug transport system ATPase subunit